MTAAILTIGDEILIGQVVNSNAAWIGAELSALGVTVLVHHTVGDSKEQIVLALDRAYVECDVVIMTGGLGPTHDDITKDAVASYFSAPLVQNDAILEAVRRRWSDRNLDMPPSNVGQALVPLGFQAVFNTAGTAPALIKADKQKLLAVLPGVPHEMKLFFVNNVLPMVAERSEKKGRAQKTLLLAGIGESDLQQQLEGLEMFLDESRSLAFLPNLKALRLRLTTTGVNAEERLAEFEKWIRERADKWIFGEGDSSLEEAVGLLLLSSSSSIAVAESCTGGLIAHTLTNVAGSSAYMRGGIVAYSNEVKTNMLGVGENTLLQFGAVSKETACEMANGVRVALQADIGLSTTGIMGPGGGSVEKPVGTVWIGLSLPGKTFALRYQFGKDRIRNKDRVVTAALNMVRRHVLHQE